MSEQKDQEVAAMAELFLHEQVNRNTVKTDITLNVFYFIFNFFLQFFFVRNLTRFAHFCVQV